MNPIRQECIFTGNLLPRPFPDTQAPVPLSAPNSKERPHGLSLFRLSKKASQNFPRKRKTKSNRFRPRRTPGWSLLPLWGNSPPVRGRKHLSGCKCRICSPVANKFCAQQTAKNWRKSPKGFFDKLSKERPHGLSLFFRKGAESGQGQLPGQRCFTYFRRKNTGIPPALPPRRRDRPGSR